jgi:paraquat-inducible protein B
MSAKVNPPLIGAFVVGAIVLAFILVVLLGGGQLLQQPRRFVVVFDSSLHGLSVGAPVAFRGVPIGQVTSIDPIIDTNESELRGVNIVVDIEIGRGKIRSAPGASVDTEHFSDAELADYFDKQGVRAQLGLQSLLTGQLFVNLDFFPGSPVNKADMTTKHPQIATIETGLQRLGRTIDTLPLEEIVAKVTNVLDGLDRIVNADEIPRTLAATERTVQSSMRLVEEIEGQIGPLLASLREATETASATIERAGIALDLQEGPAGELLANLTRAADTAEETLARAGAGAAWIEHLLSDRSPERQHLQRALSELSAAARSIRVFTDYLERHPEALIQGKQR